MGRPLNSLSGRTSAPNVPVDRVRVTTHNDAPLDRMPGSQRAQKHRSDRQLCFAGRKPIEGSSGPLVRGEPYTVPIAVSGGVARDRCAELVFPDFERVGDGPNETWVY